MIFQRSLPIRDFAKERYLATIKAFPSIKEERTQNYLMITLTFLALSFLGIFAINPTLTTIIELNKKLEDSKYVSSSLKKKLTNLSALHTHHESLRDTWPIVHAAVPDDPRAAFLLAQVQEIAKRSAVSIVDIEASQVDLSMPKNLKEQSFTFSVTVTGDVTQQQQFMNLLTSFDRVIHLESIMITTKEEQPHVTIKGRAFFTP